MPTARPAVTADAVIYLPGIMGSELVDANGVVQWGMHPRLFFRQAVFGDALRRLRPRPDDGIRASRPIQVASAIPLLSAMEPYSALERGLRRTVVRPEAVRAFAYDWRRSVADAAAALAPVARNHLRDWREQWKTLPASDRRGLSEPRLTLVGHSMGGLVATYFAALLDEEQSVHRIVTLGTPFAGSLNALRALTTGEQLPFGLFASALRDAVRTMPGVYELLPRWRCVDDGDRRHVVPADLNDIGADAALTDQAFAVMQRLSAAAGDMRIRPILRCLVGTTQPTLQSVRFASGSARFGETIDGIDHRGDGTVFRFAAIPAEIQPSYLPQSHGAVAKTDEAVAFVAAVLTERTLGEFQAPEGVGLRVPALIAAGRPFTVEILDGRPGMTCSMHDTQDNRLVTATLPQMRDGGLAATLTAPQPGLYRIAVAGGGFSPVEQLVAATD